MDETEMQHEVYLSGLSTHLARLQLLSPLSLLVFIGAALVGSLAVKPSIQQINYEYLTIMTASTRLMGVYWLVLVVLLIGHCIMLSISRKVETKETLVYGVGTRLAAVNLLMTLWIVFWALRIFVVSAILLLLAFVLVGSICATLLRYPPTLSRSMDYVFTHVPIKMLFVVLFSVAIWQNGLLALRWYRYIGLDLSGDHAGHWEHDHAVHSWAAFGVVLGVALVNSLIVFAFTDVAWAVSAVYVNVAMVVKSDGKPPQVYITLILGATLVGVAMFGAVAWKSIRERRRGDIRLPDDEVEEGTS